MGAIEEAPVIRSSDDTYKKQPNSKCRHLEVKIFLPLLILAVIGIIVGMVILDQQKKKDENDEAEKNAGVVTQPNTPTPQPNTPTPQPNTQQMADRLRQELEKRVAANPSSGPAPGVTVSSFQNWDGNVTQDEVVMGVPKSLEQIQMLLQAVNTLNENNVKLRRVRAMGGGYSYSNLYADEGQMMVDSSGLVTRPDGSQAVQMVQGSNHRKMSVLAGVTIGDMVDAMVEFGVQIPALPTIINAQVAGAVASGSHGGKSTVSEYVVGVTLVNSDGEVKTYNEEDHPEAMAALRCCVGVCGIFYEIIFKVELITFVRETHHWEPTDEVFTPELINAILNEGTFLGHWAPLTSWTTDEWDTYDSTGVMPALYEPWTDLIWYQKKVATSDAPSRRRRSVDPLPALYGGHHRSKRQVGEGGDEATAEPNPEPAPEPKPEINNSLMLHKMSYDWEFKRTSEDNDTVASLPESLAAYNATGAPQIREIGITMLDNTNLTHSNHLINMVFDSLKVSVMEHHKMPVLTIVNRWLNPSTHCYLCPNHFPKQYGDDTLVFTMSFTTATYKPSFMPWMSELFPKLSAAFPEMRVRWAYADSAVPGLLDHITSSLGQDLEDFKGARRSNGFDKHDRFLNSFVDSTIGEKKNAN